MELSPLGYQRNPACDLEGVVSGRYMKSGDFSEHSRGKSGDFGEFRGRIILGESVEPVLDLVTSPASRSTPDRQQRHLSYYNDKYPPPANQRLAYSPPTSVPNSRSRKATQSEWK